MTRKYTASAARFIAQFMCALALTGGAHAAERIKVALTWDDLPINGGLAAGVTDSAIARQAVAILEKHRIPPSYGFINAGQLERNPDGAEALKIWVKAGHPLANHTYSHIDLHANSVEDFQRDLLRNEPALALLMPGGQDWHWMRYPFLREGDTLEKRRTVRAFLSANGYRIAQTTMDFEDYLWNDAHARCGTAIDAATLKWLRDSYLDAARRFIRLGRDNARAAFGRDISHVMLLHLGSFSPHILPDFFDLLDAEGYEVVTLEEAQRDPAYAQDPDVASRWGGTHTDLIMEARKLPYPQIADKPRKELESVCAK